MLVQHVRKYGYFLVQEIAALSQLTTGGEAWRQPGNGTLISFAERAALLPALLAVASDQREEGREALAELLVAHVAAIEEEERAALSGMEYPSGRESDLLSACEFLLGPSDIDEAMDRIREVVERAA